MEFNTASFAVSFNAGVMKNSKRNYLFYIMGGRIIVGQPINLEKKKN